MTCSRRRLCSTRGRRGFWISSLLPLLPQTGREQARDRRRPLRPGGTRVTDRPATPTPVAPVSDLVGDPRQGQNSQLLEMAGGLAPCRYNAGAREARARPPQGSPREPRARSLTLRRIRSDAPPIRRGCSWPRRSRRDLRTPAADDAPRRVRRNPRLTLSGGGVTVWS
jgi:hypothetical protein